MRKHVIFVQGTSPGDSNGLFSLQLEGFTEDEAKEIAQSITAHQCGLWECSEEHEDREVLFIEHTTKDTDNA